MVAKTLRVLGALGLVVASAAPASALWIKMASLERVREPSFEELAYLSRSTFLDDGRHGWVAGATAARPHEVVIFRTTNGGESWERFEHGMRAHSVFDVEFVDARNGWLVIGPSGRLFRTSDGGESWRGEAVVGGWELSKFATKIVDVEMMSSMHGYGVGSSGGKAALFEYRITRGGRPPWWRPQVVEGAGVLTNLFVHSADWMWMYAGSLLGVEVQALRRAGSTELTPIAGMGDLSCIWSVFFIDHERGWVGGIRGDIWRTDDGGLTWARHHSGVDRAIKGIHFTSRTEGRAVGGNGEILETSNGGRDWRMIHYIEKSSTDLDYFDGEYLVTTTSGLYHDAPLRLRYERLVPRGGGG